MRISIETKTIGRGIKAHFEDVGQEPLLPEMQDLLRDLGEDAVGDLGKALGDQANPDATE
jgi:hypothetical protein